MTTIRWFILIFLLSGILLIIGGNKLEEFHPVHLIGLLVRDLGISAVIAGLIGIFDTFLKNHLFEELDKRANIDKSLVEGGVTGVFSSVDSVDWERLFRYSRSFDLVAFRNRRWRQNHAGKIKAMLKRKGRIRIYLPNPENTVVIQELAHRFSMNAEEVKDSIREAVKEFYAMQPSGKNVGAIRVYFFDRPLPYTLYHFDNDLLVTMYPFSAERHELPAVQYHEGPSRAAIVKDLERLHASASLVAKS